MDELLNQLQASGIGCHIGHEHHGTLRYAEDLKLLWYCLRGLQEMVKICERYGHRNSVSYNVKKSMCIAFDREVDLGRKFNESISCMKDLGNYV